jgi:lipase chaperone LimK
VSVRPSTTRIVIALAGAAMLVAFAAHVERAADRASPPPHETATLTPAPPSPAVLLAPAAPAAMGNATVDPASAAAEPTPGAPFASLRGTSLDGAFDVDSAGRFVPTASVVRLFDYLLSAEGEAPFEAIRARVEAEARRALPEAEAARATALFDRYVAYRRLVGEKSTGLSPGDLRGALASAHAARVETFGAEDTARMFGDQEAVAQATITESQAMLSDAGIAERDEQVAAAENALPPAIRAMHEQRAARAARVAAIVAAERSNAAAY